MHGSKPACAAPKRMAALRRFIFFFCGRLKVGGGNNRLLRDGSIESCLTDQLNHSHYFFTLVRYLCNPSSQSEDLHSPKRLC